MATVEIKSKVIEMLEHFNIKYNINNSGANLVDFDSLHIQLTGKYAESWKRWSNGVSGRNYRDLTLYLSTQGIIDESEAKSYVGSWKEAELKLNSNTGKSLVLEEVEDYDFSQMVTNPDLSKVKEKVVFTTHTPEEAGNEKHNLKLCNDMSYFSGLALEQVKLLGGVEDDKFNHSLAALRMCKISNGVSKMHGDEAKIRKL